MKRIRAGEVINKAVTSLSRNLTGSKNTKKDKTNIYIYVINIYQNKTGMTKHSINKNPIHQASQILT